MTNRFDLEQQIMACWNVTSDIDTLCEGVIESDMTTDQIANILLGMKQLYELKFDKMFRTFEELHREGVVK
jgi:uncharacterized protein YeeX (DUF496 family)